MKWNVNEINRLMTQLSEAPENQNHHYKTACIMFHLTRNIADNKDVQTQRKPKITAITSFVFTKDGFQLSGTHHVIEPWVFLVIVVVTVDCTEL